MFAEAVIAAYLNSYVVPYVNNQNYFPYDVNNASLIVDLTSNAAYPFLQVCLADHNTCSDENYFCSPSIPILHFAPEVFSFVFMVGYGIF